MILLKLDSIYSQYQFTVLVYIWFLLKLNELCKFDVFLSTKYYSQLQLISSHLKLETVCMAKSYKFCIAKCKMGFTITFSFWAVLVQAIKTILHKFWVQMFEELVTELTFIQVLTFYFDKLFVLIRPTSITYIV